MAIDLDLQKISSAYFETGQYGFPADSYGFVAVIPRENWPTPSPDALEIIDRSWRPVRSRQEVEATDEFYRIRVTVPRRELDLTEDEWFVVFDTGEAGKERAGGLEPWLGRLRDLEQSTSTWETQDRPARLAEMLYRFFPGHSWEDCPAETFPRSLAACLRQHATFDRLHADPRGSQEERP